MRKQTNLAEVKLTALALLSTEINETPYSPMIVKHPFTDTGLTALPDGNGGITMINLMEEDAQNRWRQTMAQSINKANSAYEIYMMVTKPYALTFLKFAQPSLSREDMSQILASAWTRSEAPHQDVNVTVNQLLRMFKQADPTCLMEQDEYIQFKTLDDTVTVYRGVTPHNAISISQKNKRSRLGRPTSAICSSARARSSNAPAENTNGVTAHRRSPSEETCGFISTNESAAMLSTSSESI